MPAELERVFEIAVRPISGNEERRLDAAHFLRGLRDENGGTAESTEAMARGWEELDAKPGKSLWRAVGLAGFALVLALILALNVGEWNNLIVRRDAFDAGYTAGVEERISSRLTPEQKLLMFDPPLDDDSGGVPIAREAAWRNSPDDPVMFADYLLAQDRALPADLEKDASRIDPGNAFYLYLLAGKEASRIRVSSSDRAQLEAVNPWIRKASSLPRCSSHQVELLKRRIPLLPQASLVERKASLAYIDATFWNPWPELNQVMDWIGRHHYYIQDVAQRVQYSEDAMAFLHSLCRMEVGMLEQELAIHDLISKNSRKIRLSSHYVMDSGTNKWKAICDRLDAAEKTQPTRSLLVDGKAVAAAEKTGIFLAEDFDHYARFVMTPPYVSNASLQAGRDFDHELLSRYSAYGLWFLLGGVLLLYSLFRFRMSAMIQILSLRMASLLTVRDWVWLAGCGLILPLIYVWVINRLTPLGGRGFGLAGSHFLLPMAHFIGLGVIGLCASILLLRWRMRLCAGEFGFGRENRFFGMAAVLCAVAFVPWVGWAATNGNLPRFWISHFDWPDSGIQSRSSETSMWIAAALLVMPILWLLGLAFLAMVDGSRKILYRSTSSRVMGTLCTIGMGLILAITPYFKWQEGKAYQRDEWSKFSVSQPSTSVFQYQLAVQARKENKALLGITD